MKKGDLLAHTASSTESPVRSLRTARLPEHTLHQPRVTDSTVSIYPYHRTTEQRKTWKATSKQARKMTRSRKVVDIEKRVLDYKHIEHSSNVPHMF